MRGVGGSCPAWCCQGGTGRAGCFAFAAPQEAGGPEAISADAIFAVRAATITNVWLLGAAGFWNSVVASPGMHPQIAPDAVQLAVNGVRSAHVAGLAASLRWVGYDTILAAGSLPENGVTRLRHNLRTRRDEVWQELHVRPHLAPSANARLCTYFRWFQPFAQAATNLRLPISHSDAAVAFSQNWVPWSCSGPGQGQWHC